MFFHLLLVLCAVVAHAGDQHGHVRREHLGIDAKGGIVQAGYLITTLTDSTNTTLTANLTKTTNALQDLLHEPWQLETEMADLAARSYNNNCAAAGDNRGWQTEGCLINANHVGSTDTFAVFKKQYGSVKNCAIAVSGSDDIFDWTQNFNAGGQREICGMTHVLHGFVNEVRDLFESRWSDANVTGRFHQKNYTHLSRFLSDECSSVFVTGHSLGGAIATIIAGCFSRPTSSHHLHNFRGLYTIGAPPVSLHSISGPDDATLPGRRIFIKDSHSYDAVPAIRATCEYKHPKVKAMELKEECEWSWFQFVNCREAFLLADCDSGNCALWPGDLGVRAPSANDHSVRSYVPRLDHFRQAALGDDT